MIFPWISFLSLWTIAMDSMIDDVRLVDECWSQLTKVAVHCLYRYTEIVSASRVSTIHQNLQSSPMMLRSISSRL